MLNKEMSKLLEQLRVDSPEFVVIVEGKKDVEALKAIGISRTAMINKYHGIQELCDTLAESGTKRAVILTDFDRTGQELAKKISESLHSNGIHVDNHLRQEVQRIFKVRYIERLHKIIESI